jgi:hypothetical protein
MRPLPQRNFKHNLATTLPVRAWELVALNALAVSGCANIAPLPSSLTGQPPGSQDINATVTPSSASVLLGNQLTFTATVKKIIPTLLFPGA